MKRLYLFLSVFLISLFSIAQVQIDSVVVTDETCPGNCDGTLTVYTSNGTGIEMFDIGGAPQAGNVFTGLCATSYTVTVTDALPSSDFATTNVASPTPLTYMLSTFNCSAYGVCDGQATVFISGGTPPYTITFYDGGGNPIQVGTQTSIINLCAGSYGVSVTDNNSCPGTGPSGPGITPFVITQPPPPPLSGGFNVIPASCPGVCDGSATAFGSGGVPPYTLSSPGSGWACDGDFIPSVTVTDAIGQNYVIPGFTMTAIGPDILFPIVTSETCNGSCDAQVDANNITNYFPPQQYSIDGVTFQSSPIFTGLCDGFYQIWVTDSKGCLAYEFVSINPVTTVVTTASWVSDPTTIGGCDGVATGGSSGGTPGYTYQWVGCAPTVFSSTPSGNPTINNLCAGDYQLIAMDANGCTSATSTSGCITITDPIATGISKKDNDVIINIYPNPTTGTISFNFSDDVQLPITIEVINVYGKVVQTKTFLAKNDQSMDLSSLAKGVYFLNNTDLKIKKAIILK